MPVRTLTSLTAVAAVIAGGLLAPSAAAAAADPPDAALASSIVAASASDPSLSPTPYQGWNTYYGLGGDFTGQEVLDVADFLVSSGLADAGYDIVWLDGGWQDEVPRGDDGILRGDVDRFPEGMKALADAIHAKGLRAGIYTDAGPYIPGTCGLGSHGHYQTDADTFAEWGYDAVKVDFLCGIAADLDPKTVFTEFATALRNNASGRPMIFNLCNPVTSPDWGDYPEEQQSTYSWSYAPAIAESWRTYTDSGFVGMMKYSDVLRNYDANARHPEAAGPGHWNDPDYIGPELGMTDEEFRTQMTLWAVAAAPLVIASDPRTLNQSSMDALLDEDVLAVNQDPLGVQAVRVGEAGTLETWVKPLADGSVAVALLNRGDQAAQVATTTQAIGLSSNRAVVRDAWDDTTSEVKSAIRDEVPAHGASLLIVSKAKGIPQSPRLTVSAPVATSVDGGEPGPAGVLATGGSQVRATVTLHNDGTTPVTLPRLTLNAPEGWSAVREGHGPLLVRPGGSKTVDVTIDVAADAAPGAYDVTATTTFLGIRGSVSVTSPGLPVVVAPAPPAGAGVVLSHHDWISATSGWMDPAVDSSVGSDQPITIAGTVYDTGLGVASPSDIRYYLGGACTRIAGAAGIDDIVDTVGPDGGTATFALVADGAVVWESGTVARGSAVTFDVDLTGVRELTLRVGDAGDGGYNDRADWAAPIIDCA